MMDKCDERVLRAVAFEAERTKVVERERDDLLARVERAEAERDALRADALRYRWLRERECWIRDPEGDKVVIAATGYGLDAAIDRITGGQEDTVILSAAAYRSLLRSVSEARREALEEAAALATERTKMHTDFSTSWHIARDCASAIRALADAPDAGAGG